MTSPSTTPSSAEVEKEPFGAASPPAAGGRGPDAARVPLVLPEDCPPSRPFYPARRLSAIDVVRGAFMFIILAGHAASNLNHWPSSHALEDAVGPFFQSGTVGFTLVSGTLLGSFAATRPDMRPILRRYRQQGIRLLLVAHPLIALALYGPLHRPEDGFLRFLALRHYVTDILGILFLALAPLVPKIRPRTRLWAGIFFMACLRVLRATDGDRHSPFRLAREILAGVPPHKQGTILIDNYALLGILGMFLIGTYVGDVIGRARKRGTLHEASRVLFRSAVWIQSLTVVLVATYAGLKLGYLPDIDGHIKRAFYPERSGSFFPAYLGFVLTLFALGLQRDATGAKLTLGERALEVVGKTSLVSYVFQYVLVQTLPYLLGLQRQMTVARMTVWTAGSAAALILGATAWNRYIKKV